MGKKFAGLDGLKYFWQKVKVKIEEAQKTVADKIAEVENTLTAETQNRENADKTLQTNIDAKVDKVDGKGLSTNDYTTEEKNKLAGLNNYDDTAVKSSIQSNADAITAETSARENADKSINEKISILQENKNDLVDITNDLYEKLTDEKETRSSADIDLQTQITSNKTAIESEVTRATTAENNLSASISTVGTNLSTHTNNKSNPHAVTKIQVGLGNVPNVATNDQTPTFTEASSNTALSSGEKLSVAFGKIAKAISSLISHLANKSNPHGVTKAQVGLGSVVNTGDSATPTSGGTTKFTTGGAYTLKQAIDKNTTAIATLNGTGNGSVAKTVADKIAEVVAGAPESLDTLKEISDWIDTHEDSASAMNTAIQANTTAITNEAKAREDSDKALQTAIDGKAAASHTHDDRYYTETEINIKLAGKSDTGHTHTKSQINDFPTSLKNPNALTVNGKTYDGSSAVDAGVQTIANGGTGATTAKGAEYNLIGSVEIVETTPTDDRYIALRNQNVAADNGSFRWTKCSSVWSWIQSKISSVLGLTATAYGGKATTAGTADKTVNDITITIPYKTENTRYVILLGKIPAPTSTDTSSPYNWDVCGLIDVIRAAGHCAGHIRFSTGHGFSHAWRTYVDCDYLGYTAVAGGFSPLDIKCFQYGGEWWLGVQMTLGHGRYSCNAHITYKRGVPKEFLTAIPYYSNYLGETVYNEEINSSIQDVPSAWLVTRTWQNSIKAPTFIGALSGNASSATKATQDASGNVITDTYATKTELSGKSDTGHTHDDRYYTESEVDTKLAAKANSSHTHTKSQITDFPTSLKNPNALTFGSKTYDGSEAKTITAADLGALTSHQPVDAELSVASENPIQNKAVFEALILKADKGDKLSDYGIIDAYTKEETNSLLSGVIGKSAMSFDETTGTLTISLVE